MKPIELPILCHTPEGLAQERMGVEVPLEDSDVKFITFYHIDAISPSSFDVDMTAIFTSGDNWICPKTYKEVKKLIDEANL